MNKTGFNKERKMIPYGNKIKEEIKAKQVAVEDQPKKKRVVKKKSSDE